LWIEPFARVVLEGLVVRAQARFADLAKELLERCDILAGFTEEPGKISRPFPSAAMHKVHASLSEWMQEAGLAVRRDAVGNLIGHYAAEAEDTVGTAAQVFIIGSHLDSVPNAGKYDGILGVLAGVAAVKALGGKRRPFAIDVVGFCEEEGIRFRTPYLGSLALTGRLDSSLLERTDKSGISLRKALRDFGLDPARLNEATYPAGMVQGYLELHIEQGPVLESQNLPLGIVEAIVGQTRSWLRFEGQAGHAGTLPMTLRHDALAAAAEFVLAVEQQARAADGLRATVGTLSVAPGAVNVVPGLAALSLDVRHRQDSIRVEANAKLLGQASDIAGRRGVRFCIDQSESFAAVQAGPRLTDLLATAASESGHAFMRMDSGAGHDAAVMADLAPMTMLFVRSPAGVSHHPDEAVLPADVAAALEVMAAFIQNL
jgi:allantoate deiminase